MCCCGKAACIITGDKHLLKLLKFRGISILKPREFVEDHLEGKWVHPLSKNEEQKSDPEHPLNFRLSWFLGGLSIPWITCTLDTPSIRATISTPIPPTVPFYLTEKGAEKVDFHRLLKNDQVQGARNPVDKTRPREEWGVLERTPQWRRMRGAVATGKEQLFARPREGEQAG